MIEIRYIQISDKAFWYNFDKHLPEAEFANKVHTRRGYVMLLDNTPIGILRYSLFWDNTPFCNLICLDTKYHRQGYGKQLIEHWEKDMIKQSYGILLTSTQVDETAQHFYRKLGYKDCGGLLIDIPAYAQPMELFFIKAI